MSHRPDNARPESPRSDSPRPDGPRADSHRPDSPRLDTQRDTASAESWYEVVVDVGADCAEPAAGILAAQGFGAAEVRGDAGHPGAVVVSTQAENDADAGRFAESVTAALPQGWALASRVAVLDPTVWTQNWRKHFPRLRIGDRLEVLPPWEPPSPADQGLQSIVINPGMAFGTGQHETTLGCLELLEELVSPGDVVADIGCGSGLLAIAALRLGAARALATDNDPEAVNATRANAVVNHVTSELTAELAPCGPPPRFHYGKEMYDIVVANILAESLVELHACLTSCVKRGGRLFLSGIEATRLPLVEQAFIGPGWTLLRRLHKGPWVTLALARDSDPSIASTSDAEPA